MRTIAETLRRDITVGFRVLIKEKSFCALAVIVLALGIAGVTTMFSVVNGVMLRGFSLPNAGRLASLNFIDPSSTTFFGVNGQVSSKDYEELLPQQQSFERLAAYLNGSTVNITVDGHPQRYTGAYVTDEFLRILGMSPLMGRDFTAADNHSGAGKVAIIGHAIWQRDFGGVSDIIGKGIRLNGKAATVIGVMPKGFAFPTNEELWIPLFSEFPLARAQRSGGQQPRGARSAEGRSVARSGERRGDDHCAAVRGGLSRHEQAVQYRAGPTAARDVHAAAAARHAVDDARVLCGRAADLVRQRDEHAVRAGDAAREGAGGALVARRHRASA